MCRTSPLVALIALAAVLVVGSVGYNVLGSQRSERTVEPKAAAPVEALAGPESDGSAGSATEDALMLADYDAVVYTLEDDAVALTQIADGKPLVINFWATWCPYCVEELPDFQEIVYDYEGRVSFAFIDAADGERETAKAAFTWIVENGFEDLPVYYDTALDAVYAFGVYAFPTTVVVSADGEILAVQPGTIDADLMRNALDSLV